MKKRLLYGFASVLLVLSVLVVVWQGSFRLQQFGPANPQQTFIFWAISSLILILMLVLGWVLVREGVKLYVARQSHRLGSHIRTKLVLGAMGLSFVPVFFLVFWSYEVLNLNLKVWFTNPVANEIQLFVNLNKLLDREMENRLNSQAELLAGTPEVRRVLADGTQAPGFLDGFRQARKLEAAAILPSSPGSRPLDASGPYPPPVEVGRILTVLLPVKDGGRTLGYVSLSSRKPVDAATQTEEVKKYNHQWAQIVGDRRNFRTYYTMLMALITLFVLFFAQWIARILANRISVPITALLDGASEVRRGNLKHRVNVRAEDELATLVRGFNQMTEELETSAEELDRRRRFTEAILESIPTGVISIGADGGIQRVNRALSKIFPAQQADRATRLEDLFSREDIIEIKYLMKRARRTGVASRQLEWPGSHAGAARALHEVFDLDDVLAREQVFQACRSVRLLRRENLRKRPVDALDPAVGADRNHARRDALQNGLGEPAAAVQFLRAGFQLFRHLVEAAHQGRQFVFCAHVHAMFQVAAPHLACAIEQRGDGHADPVGQDAGNPLREEQHEQRDESHQHGVVSPEVSPVAHNLGPLVVVLLDFFGLRGCVDRLARRQRYVAERAAAVLNGQEHGQDAAYFHRRRVGTGGIERPAAGRRRQDGRRFQFPGLAETVEKTRRLRAVRQYTANLGCSGQQLGLRIQPVLHLPIQQLVQVHEKLYLVGHRVSEPYLQIEIEDFVTPEDQKKHRHKTEAHGPQHQFGADVRTQAVALPRDIEFDAFADQDPTEHQHQNQNQAGDGPEDKRLLGIRRAELLQAERALPYDHQHRKD